MNASINGQTHGFDIVNPNQDILSYMNTDKGFTVSYFVRIPYGYSGYYSFNYLYTPVKIRHSYNGNTVVKEFIRGGYSILANIVAIGISSQWTYVRCSLRYDETTNTFKDGSIFIKNIETDEVKFDYDDTVDVSDPGNRFFSFNVDLTSNANYDLEIANITYRNKYITGPDEVPTPEVWGVFYDEQ